MRRTFGNALGALAALLLLQAAVARPTRAQSCAPDGNGSCPCRTNRGALLRPQWGESSPDGVIVSGNWLAPNTELAIFLRKGSGELVERRFTWSSGVAINEPCGGTASCPVSENVYPFREVFAPLPIGDYTVEIQKKGNACVYAKPIDSGCLADSGLNYCAATDGAVNQGCGVGQRYVYFYVYHCSPPCDLF